MIADIASGIGAAIAAAKSLNDILKKVKDAQAQLALSELQVKLAEALNSVADVKIEMAELKTENARLRAEKADLERTASAKPEMKLVNGLYVKADGDGPYCTTCFDTRGTAIRLIEQRGRQAVAFGRWHCGVCKSDYR